MSRSDLGTIPLGQRVTVRHRLPDGRATDAVGTLTARAADSVTVQTRHGEVRVPLASVVAHRLVRPTPWRVATFLRGAGVAVIGLDRVPAEAEKGDGAPPSAVAALGALVPELTGAGIPVMVLADGHGREPEPLWGVGTVELGEPGREEAWAAAHTRLEHRLGREVTRSEVRFTDDRPERVAAARRVGWQARVLTPPG